MCFKTEIHITRTEIEARFGRQFQTGENFEPRYYFNAFDFPKMPIIAQQSPDKIRLMSWGLIPSWISNKENALAFRKNTLNAKFETLNEKKSFKNVVENQRCLLIVHGFFEYQHQGKNKIPYYIRRKDNRAFAIAGIFDEWVDLKTGEKLIGFSLITCEANSLLAEIHNSQKRMPLILPEELENTWIDKLHPTKYPDYIKPISDNFLEAWQINDIPLKDISFHNSPKILEKRKSKENQQLSLF